VRSGLLPGMKKDKRFCRLEAQTLMFSHNEMGTPTMMLALGEARIAVDKKRRTIKLVTGITGSTKLLFDDGFEGWIEAIEDASKAKFADFYEVINRLGDGQYGAVKLCRDKATNERVAAKTILKKRNPSERQTKYIIHELRIMRLLSHSNIVHCYDVFDTRKSLTIVMEYFPCGDLWDALEPYGAMSERETAETLRELLLAVAFLHEHGVVHRDIKLENVLVRSRVPPFGCVLADFGLSNIVEPDEEMWLGVGTPAYLAPEMIRREMYGPKVDAWALGVIMFVMLVHDSPFEADTDKETRLKVLSSREWEGKIVSWSPAAQDLVRKLLERDVDERITVAEALVHPFIAERK